MPATKPLGAQISHMLKDRGVDVIFGIPGVHNQELYRGIEEAGIRHILARHEQGVGFMADGYARATGRPGVCYVITGPGLCNIMTPLGQAYSDSVPVLCISSCLDDVAGMKGQLHQMLDQEGAAATVCDWSETARSPQAAYDLIDRALLEFACDRPRPKSITLPIAALQAGASNPPNAMPVVHRSGVAKAQVDQITEALNAAHKPVFILGGGAIHAAEFALDVVTRSGAAVFTTYAADGCIADDLPTFFGCYLGRPGSADILAEADLVIALGTELAEVDLWRTELGHTCPLIRVDIDPLVLADHHRADIRVLADAKDVLDGVAKADIIPATGWDAQAIATLKTGWRAEVDMERPGIVAICDILRDAVPEDTMIYSDMTQFAYVAKEVWPMSRPGHWHHPTGFGTLGYALPAAIGGAVARPGLPTMAILGDYGFQYTVQDLGTAVELGQPLPIILWDNGKLKEIEDSMVNAQIAPNAVIARNPDFLALAKAYGARAVQPADAAALRAAVADAFAADGPSVILLTPEFQA